MKIAFISYEYPPDTAFGGIATYVYQAARMMQRRGHQVEVFSGSGSRTISENVEGILVHRTEVPNRVAFPESVVGIFRERHEAIQFDVLESPEIGAEAKLIIANYPSLPLVVKLHTPTFICTQLGYIEPSLDLKLRRFFGALRRWQLPHSFVREEYNFLADPERAFTLQADVISNPSISIGSRLTDEWQIPKDRIYHLPYPYIPSDQLLEIPVETHTNVISFIGRLEMRKGVTDLMEAIPLVLKQYPQVKFRFVGKSGISPSFSLGMQQYIEKKLKKFGYSLEFTGSVTPENIPNMLAITDICVFPSRWENFPNVCLEAMAAGRGIIGSSAGGMADMLDNNQAGLLIPPSDPVAIAKAICTLLADPDLRMRLGQAARERVLSEYNNERIGALQEESYTRAIKRRQQLGSR